MSTSRVWRSNWVFRLCSLEITAGNVSAPFRDLMSSLDWNRISSTRMCMREAKAKGCAAMKRATSCGAGLATGFTTV